MKLSLLQKVLISAKTLYDKNVVTFTSKDLFHEFINNDFFTPEKDWEKAMVRRMVDLKNMGLIEITWKFGKYTVYKLTHHGKRVKPYMVHIGVSLLMREPSKELKDMPKRLKTGKSDRIRTSRELQEIKKENDVLNKKNLYNTPSTVEYWDKEQQKKMYDKIKKRTSNNKWSNCYPSALDWYGVTITDILHPMSEKPKHTLRQHLKSLFWL